MTKEERIMKIQKFTQDPDWVLVEELIHEYIEPLRDISTIELNRGADAVMADVAGRQKAYEGMTKFLRECRILGRVAINNNVSFK